MTRPEEAEITGRIIAHHGVRVRIEISGRIVEFKPPRRESWVVGDIVIFSKGRPKRILPRTTALSRFGADGKIQTLAANIDTLLIVTACDALYKPGLIDRFIVAASHAEITPVVVLNKTDLDPDHKYETLANEYKTIGYRVIYVSATTGDRIDDLVEQVKGRVSALVGQSGVGKTSLFNLLIPGSDLPIGDVNEKTSQGRHTTSAALLVAVPTGGDVIDSPGIRQFVPSGLTRSEVARYFPGVERYTDGCKFRDCLHISEPECSVADAVEQGSITIDRYESYKRLLESVQEKETPAWQNRHPGEK